MSPWTRWRCSSGYNISFLIWWSEVRLSVAIKVWSWVSAVPIASSSTHLMVLVKPAPLDSIKLELPVLGWKCPNSLFAFLDMAATICVGPEISVSNLEGETRFGLMGNGGHFIQSRFVGAFCSLYFIWVKFLKLFETRCCPSMPSITDGVLDNAGDVQICFGNVTGKILQPCRIVAVKV